MAQPRCSSDGQPLTAGSDFTCLDTGAAIGLATTAEAGLLSLFAILVVAIIIMRNGWRRRHSENVAIFQHPMDILMASLILADTLHGIATAMSLKWVKARQVEAGAFCTAQGIIMTFGSAGVAFSTLVMAIYTFIGVWMMKDISSMKLTFTIVTTFWAFIAFLVTLGMGLHRDQNFMAPAPYWCWINLDSRFIAWKVVLTFLWEWLALLISISIYVPLYLWMRGNLVIDEAAWWRFHFTATRDEGPESRAMRRKSLVMLAYPAVYSVIVPLTAVRWIKFAHPESHIPPAATFAVMSIASLLGVYDIVLLLTTRPNLFGRLLFAR